MRLGLSILVFLMLVLSCQEQNKRSYSASAPFLEEGFSQVDSLIEHLQPAEKIGQLIIFSNDNQSGFSAQNVAALARSGRIGGLWLKDLILSDYLTLIETETQVPLINMSSEAGLLNNLFTDISAVPGTSALLSYPSDTLKDKLVNLRKQQAYALGVNCQVVPAANKMWYADQPDKEYLSLFNQRILGLERAFGPRFFEQAQDTLVRKTLLKALQPKVDRGLCGFYLPKDSLTDPGVIGTRISDVFQTELNFDGLLVADASDSTQWNNLLVHGVDLFVVNQNPESLTQFLLAKLRAGQWNEVQLDQKLRKVLQAKFWTRSPRMQEPKPLPLPNNYQASVVAVVDRQPVVTRKIPQIETHLRAETWEMISRQIYEKSVVVIPDTNLQIPFPEIAGHKYYVYHYADETMREFNKSFARYASLTSTHKPLDQNGVLTAPEPPEELGAMVLILLDQQMLKLPRDTTFMLAMQELVKQYPVIIFNFGSPDQLAPFDDSFTVIQLPERNEVTEEMAAQLLFGGLASSGKLAYDINASFREGMGAIIDPSRLGYSPPQMVGIAPERLVGIDAILLNAIDEKVFPGCEVLVAKNGKVFYSKTFGYQTFDEKRPIRENYLYDIASITKVAATTMAVMELYDEGKLKLEDKLKSHLSLEPKATISDISLKKLLIHQSGLPAYLPVGDYLRYRDQPNAGCDSFYCNKPSDIYTIQVADQFYFKGSYLNQIWEDLQQMKLKKTTYRYSDANFVLLQRVVEQEVGQGLNTWLDSNFYQSLGLRYTCFQPLQKFGAAVIAPTQQDDRWRHQLVSGYVHDETAALLGGVAGHAGLFSNAGDLAVIGQLLLNRGTYGGHRYFKESTVRLFTSGKHGNHRGLGFDKPSEKYNSAHAPSASEQSFGHTGFTGTCFWMDPTEDLVFVFLSNRINPDIDNKKLFQNKIRERVHEIVYDALDSYRPALPQLVIDVPGA